LLEIFRVILLTDKWMRKHNLLSTGNYVNPYNRCISVLSILLNGSSVPRCSSWTHQWTQWQSKPVNQGTTELV